MGALLEPPLTPVVDVRDMQCAQALALASSAMRKLAPGECLELVCNTADVLRDLVVWARECQQTVVSRHTRDGDTRLTMRKGS